jgi:hypothetical protein
VLDGVEYIHGHLPFGVHELLGRKVRYQTILRQPVDLFRSLYNFSYQRHQIDENMSVTDFLASPHVLDNPQTRQICGIHALQGECGEETLQQAKFNLDNYYALVGITEHTYDFIKMFITYNRWNNIVIPKTQVTKTYLKRTFHDKEVQQILENNRFDLELYEHARSVYHKHLGMFRDMEEDTSQRDVNIVYVSDFVKSNKVITCSAEEFEAEHAPKIEHLLRY